MRSRSPCQRCKARSRVIRKSTTPNAPIVSSAVRNARGCTSMLFNVAASPRMRPMLQMQEPTALPKASPAFPREAAMIETTSSGVVVARLTMVEPITTRGMRRNPAMRTAAATNKLPPWTSRARPARSMRMSESMGL